MPLLCCNKHLHQDLSTSSSLFLTMIVFGFARKRNMGYDNMENDCNNNNDDDNKKEKNKCLRKINELSHSLSNDSVSKCIV